MYEQNLKFGQAVIVCGSRPCLGTSTAAAMLSAAFTNGGDQTLLISTDYVHPYDAPSLLSDIITDNYMDELIALENSNGLTPENLNDYTGTVNDMLAYTRLSTKIGAITRDTTRTLEHILDIACRVYRYVVLDLDFANTMYLNRLSEQADAVVYLFGQDFQSMKTAKSLTEHNSVSDNAIMFPVLMNRLPDIPINEESLGKILNTDSVMVIEHDPEVFKASQKRGIADFMCRGCVRHSGIKMLFKRPDEEESIAHASVLTLCKTMKNALVNRTDGDAS